MVRVGFPGGPRLEWYDRNPLTRTQIWVGLGIAPHAVTDRGSYTVPTGKKAFLETAFCSARRATAPTTSGRVGSAIYYTPSAGSPGYMLQTPFNNAAVDSFQAQVVGQAGCLVAGDIVGLITLDESTGGTCDYRLTAKITEFNA